MKKLFILTAILLLCVDEAHSFPVKYDLRDEHRAPASRDQKVLETCWAFAALGACESSYMTRDLTASFDLNTNMFLDSDFTFTGKGDAFTAAAILSRRTGTTRLRDVYLLSKNHRPDNDVIKKLIMNHGAVYTGIYFDETQHESYGNFTTYFDDNRNHQANHDVLIIGWDDNFPLFRFTPRASSNGAWLVQNSWGKNKYFWIPYEQSISTGAAFIITDNNPSERIYHYDDLGYCNAIPYDWSANIFRIREDYEHITAASFYTSFNAMDYELYIYEFGSVYPDSPVSGHLIAKLSGTCSLAGYHTVFLPEALSMWHGEYFSIVLKLNRKIAPVETQRANYSDNAAIHEHESFFSLDGIHWTDGVNLNANACIKAFTVIKK